MTKRIIIFGDSYSAEEPGLSWTKLLAEKDDCQYINFAVNGSSTEYAISKFMQFVRTEIIEPDDVIIFQFSTKGRIHFMHQLERPGTAAQYQLEPKFHNVNEDHAWYNFSRQHIKWYLANRDQDLLLIQHTSYLHLLKTFAENNPTNPVIILKLDDYFFDNTIPISSRPDNLFIVDLELYKISQLESFGVDHFEFIKNTIADVRANHMTLPNRHIFASMLLDIIKNRTTEHCTYDLFQKDIMRPIKNKQDYIEYVNTGILEDRSLPDDWFK